MCDLIEIIILQIRNEKLSSHLIQTKGGALALTCLLRGGI